uniref:Bax inhibitor-1/YccA family protein n=1 Tax=Caulobacter sp. (strain K31) TaxID=366602 RepID=B0T0M0_CAUSK
MTRRSNDGFGFELARPEAGAQHPGFMIQVWLWMAGAALISAASAWACSNLPALSQALFTPRGLTAAGWGVTLAPLLLVMVPSGAVTRLSPALAAGVFIAYAVLVGLSLGGVVAAYTGHGLALTFVAVAAGFAGLALLGAITRADLSGLGVFGLMSVMALIVAMIANLLFDSSTLDLAISAIGVLVFAGLTAFDIQRINRLQVDDWSDDRAPILAALTLYLDLLNIFLFALRLGGRRR